MRDKLVGRYGEEIAAGFLRKKGYTILASGYRGPVGEIDLIARKVYVLCFVDVKTRSGQEYGAPRQAVDARKQQRIAAADAGQLCQLHRQLTLLAPALPGLLRCQAGERRIQMQVRRMEQFNQAPSPFPPVCSGRTAGPA